MQPIHKPNSRLDWVRTAFGFSMRQPEQACLPGARERAAGGVRMPASRAGLRAEQGDRISSTDEGIIFRLRAGGPALTQAAIAGERWLRPSLPVSHRAGDGGTPGC